MRAPDFWRQDGLLPWLLTPAALTYDLLARLKTDAVRPKQADVPVVCVGNLTVGGSGKTPAALAVARLLRQLGRAPHFLTRGYGGRLAGPVRVDPGVHSAREVGDEALLLAEAAPTWVSRRRPDGAQLAAANGADVLVMDDGFQNPSLVKDLSFVVIDAGAGFGNGRLLPAGPLREPVARGLAHADAVLLIADQVRGFPELTLPLELPVFRARIEPDLAALALRDVRVFGFAGIARPEKFHMTLAAIGAEVVAFHSFPDHHRWHRDEIMALVENAVALNARPVTTAKDAVRLPPEARAMIDVVAVDLILDEPARVAELLRRACAKEA